MIYQRTLAEIDDQLDGWAKVEALHVKKEAKFIKVEIKEEEEGREANGGDGGSRREGSDGTLSHQEVEVKIEPKEEEDEEGDEKVKEEEEEEEEESDEDDFDELLDWRSKGT